MHHPSAIERPEEAERRIAPESGAEADSGAACAAILLRLNQIPSDPKQIEHELAAHGAALTDKEIVRYLMGRGMKARLVTCAAEDLAKMPTPGIIGLRAGGFAILGRIDGDKVGFMEPAEKKAKQLAMDDFLALWDGRLILATKRVGWFHGILSGPDVKFDLSWFIPAVMRYKGALGEVFFSSIVLQLFALVSPLFFQIVVDKVLAHHSLGTLDVLMIGFIAIILFEATLGGLRSYIFSHTANRIDVALGARLFNHMQRLPLSYFHSRQVGETVARMRELESIRSFITESALSLVLDTAFASIFILVMFWYSTKLTLIVLCAMPLLVILSIAITPALRRRIQDKFSRAAQNQSFLVETVSAIETVKAMAVEPQMQRRWEDQLAGYVGASFRAAILNVVAGQSVQVITKLTTAAILYFGAQAVIEGQLTVGQLVAFNMLSGHVTNPILRLAQMWQEFQQVRISVDRVGDILNAPAESAAASRTALPRIKGEVLIDHVTFRYRSDGKPVLHGLSLWIAAGQTLGIVGPSGSGKSTVTKLLQKLYLPETGRVLVDGVDLSSADPVWLRRQIGVVLQENVLFNRSIRDNIALADPGASDEHIVQAAQLAGAHDFILAQPEGYDTMLGEHGVGLSGGQRQRIAIARALMVDPRILIFDEATSALDLESEFAIQRNMKAICEGRTVIIIAHRLAAVRQAHRIVTIEEGRVVEDGDHDSLIQSGGRYAKLYALQNGGGHEE